MRRFALALLLASTGCFIDPNALNDGGDGSSGGNDLSASGDGSLSGDGSVTVEKTGSVVVAQYQTGPTSGSAPTPLHVVSAGFFDVVSTPCAITTVGACQVQKCANTAPTANNNAGIITITGGAVGTSTLTPNGDTYTPVMMNTLYWNAPVTLSVSASGGDVPAFAGSVGAPALITVTSPALPDMLGPPTTQSKSSDLTFSWTGGNAGTDVEITLASLPSDYFIKCKFGAQTGTGSIPSSLLTQMFNDGATSVRATLNSIGSTTITAGDFKVGFLAINAANYAMSFELE